MTKLLGHIKKFIVRGFQAIIPLALTYFAIKIFYTTIDQNAVKLVDQRLGFTFPGLGILLVLASLYMLGTIRRITGSSWVLRKNLTKRYFDVLM